MIRNAAIVEFSQSHYECIPTVASFLSNNAYCVKVIGEGKSKNVSENVDYIDIPFSELSTLKGVMALLESIKKNKVNFVFFNTAVGSHVKLAAFILLFYPSIKCSGIIHNIHKITTSFGKRIILTKLTKVFVLSETLCQKIKKTNLASNFSYFYPIHYHVKCKSLTKPNNEVWIGIPGNVEAKRRDYSSLFEIIKSLSIKSSYKFFFLGSTEFAEPSLQREIVGLKKECFSQVHFWNHFLDDITFHSHLKNMDFLLPLLNPDFYQHRISGVFNLACAYKVPLLISTKIPLLHEYRGNAIYYNEGELLSLLADNKLLAKKEDVFNNTIWSYNFQKKQFFEHLPFLEFI